jgi:hypothetical protein
MPFPQDDDLDLDDIELEDIAEDEGEDETVEDEDEDGASEDTEAAEGDKEAAKGERETSNVTSRREPGRAETRIQKLANNRREAEERAAKAEAELKVLRDAQENAQRTQQQYQQQQMEQERLRAAWEQASPEDRVAMMLQKQRQDTEALLFQQQAVLADNTDKMNFRALTASDKVAAKLEHEVEARLVKTRSMGFNASREDIYKHLLGERIMAARSKAAKEQGSAGKARIKKQTVKSRSATSDRPGGRSAASEQEKRRKRLENMII